MTAPTSTPISSIAIIFFSSMIGSIGMAFLKMGSAHLHKGILHIVNRNAFFGVALFLVSSVLYLKGISNGQLSVLYPMVATSYCWALLWAKLFFKEQFTREKLV